MEERNTSNNGFYKVGIRLLSLVQLENIFPNYQDLLDRIESYREMADYGLKGRADHYQYNLMYDNVFAIFGKRGTGKTSVAFTLQNILEKDKKNMVLPIIIPEVVPDECSALVWLFAIIRAKVEEMERENAERKRKGKDSYWANCHYQEREKAPLTQRLDELQGLLFAGKYNPSGEVSYYRAVENSAKQVLNSYKFSCEVTKFWDAWVEELKKCNGDDTKNPLIFFIFDDVDLEPQKVTELLSIIIKYLSHPNLIVLTTADEELFLEVIENNLDKAIGRLPKEWRIYLSNSQGRQWRFWDDEEDGGEHEGDLIAQTSRMYLGKVLPTSTRYYLKLFESAQQKQQFRLEEEEFLGDSMCRLVERLEVKKEGEDTFLRRSGKMLLFYLNFIGDTSRQIGNAYLEFKMFLTSLERELKKAQRPGWDRELGLNRIYQQCRYFLYSEISANHDLAAQIDNMERLVSGLFQMEFNEWKFYVNYNYLNEFLEELGNRQYEGERDKLLPVVLQLYALLMLLENILLVLEKRIPNGVTGRKRVHGIIRMCSFITNYILAGESLFRTDLSAEDFFLHYNQLFDKLCRMRWNKDNLKRFYQEYLYSFLDVPYEGKEVHYYGLRRMMEDSREWMHTITGQIAMIYGNMYLIEEQDARNSIIFYGEDCVTAYQDTIRDELKEHFRRLFKPLDLYEEAVKFLECLKDGSQEYLDLEKYNFDKFIEKVREELLRQGGLEEQNEQGSVYLPMENIIQTVIQQGGKNPLATFLSLYASANKEEEQKERLLGVLQGTEPANALMRSLANTCQEWDFAPHRLALFEGTEWMNRLRQLEISNEESNRQRQTLYKRLSRRMGKQNKKETEEDTWIILKGTPLYRAVREELESFWKKAGKFSREEEERLLREEIVELLRNMDIMIDLNQVTELEEAVQVGVVVALMQQLQKIYICQTIRRKYDIGHSRSSQGMERKKGGNTGRGAETEKNAYYYEMFRSIKDILEKKTDWKAWIQEEYPGKEESFYEKEKKRVEKEMPALQNFLRRSVEGQRDRYIRMLLGEE